MYRSVQIARGAARRAAARPYSMASSTTYSGGQASEGQGGFYGSGGSRKNDTVVAHRPEALADPTAMERLMEVMAKVETENKATVKAMMSSPEVSALLASLEFNGQPKWGLSTLERETVKAARALA
uniref:Uncharacterized protein n=1 Tax=Phaeomonas parva TaxID=124430 RepID=A0A7S1XQB6_9STRA|mmetsp:Transcript_23586/g.74062  ORF Transcript_23586/g.74062 Transcript_23586/m.74062 type:complete len:126 (+) Transcript_23586:354-731(+)